MKCAVIFIATLLLMPLLTAGSWAGQECGKSCMSFCKVASKDLFDTPRALNHFCKEECGLGKGPAPCTSEPDGCCVPDTGDPDCEPPCTSEPDGCCVPDTGDPDCEPPCSSGPDRCCVPDTGDPDCDLTCWTSETCNRQFCLPDISTQPNYIYNEGLSTILRGIVIEGDAAVALGVLPGYYRIREFRVWDQPDQKVITLNILKNYGVFVGGAPILPKQEDEWVFSIIDSYSYDPTGWTFVGYDFHGHQLAFEILFTATCHDVVYARLDCLDLPMSTQTYTTGRLYSCGWGEPPWTVPGG